MPTLNRGRFRSENGICGAPAQGPSAVGGTAVAVAGTAVGVCLTGIGSAVAVFTTTVAAVALPALAVGKDNALSEAYISFYCYSPEYWGRVLCH